MAKTITLTKLIQKLQDIKDEQGNLKVLIEVTDTESQLYALDPTALSDEDVVIDDGVLVLQPYKRLSDIDELLTTSSIDLKENKKRSYDMDSESEEETDEDTEDESFLDDFKDDDVDDWEYDNEDE